MSHIAIDARIINSSTGTYVQKLLEYLQQDPGDHDYTVLVPSKDLEFMPLTHPRFRYVACDHKNYSLAEQTAFKKQLDDLQADLVHFCMPQQPLLYRGKTVTTFHDLSLLRIYNSDKNWLVYHLKQFIGKFVFYRAAHKTTHIITPTDFVKHDVATTLHVDPAKITRTYEAADIETNDLEAYDMPYKRFLLYVGQQSDYKNIARLGDAHQKLLERYPDLGLILVGKVNASAQKNKDYFERRGYKNIHFTGFVSNAQRDWLYTQTAAYVFPSLTEGFGLPGLEAMAAGAPVVSSDATCLPEVYGDAALYFDPKNTDDMAEKITQVLDDKALRSELIERGHARVNNYSWHTMAEQTRAVYERALES